MTFMQLVGFMAMVAQTTLLLAQFGLSVREGGWKYHVGTLVVLAATLGTVSFVAVHPAFQ